MIVWVHFIKVSLFSVRMPYLMTKIFNRKIGFDNIFLKVGWNTYLMRSFMGWVTLIFMPGRTTWAIQNLIS